MDSESKIWQRMRDANRYFINQNFLKYGVSKDNTDFEKRNKGLWVFGTALLLVCINAAVMAFAHSIIVGIPCILASAYIFLWILRKFVFDEKNFKRLMAENNTKSEIGINGPLNNLLSIDENDQWFYQNDRKGLRSSFLVTFDYASLLDLSLASTRVSIEDAMVPFIRELHQNHFSFSKYDISVKRKISLGTLKEIQQTKLLQEGSWLQLVEQLQNETLSSLEQNSSNTYKIFFLISNNDFRKLPNFRVIIQSIIDSTLVTQNSIVNPRVCDTEETINFITNYYQISSFDPHNIKRNVQHMDISKYFEFVGFFDINGVEYKLGDFADFKEPDNTFGNQPLDEKKLSKLEQKEQELKKKREADEKQKKLSAEKARYRQMMTVDKTKHRNLNAGGVYREDLIDENASVKQQNENRKKDIKKRQDDEKYRKDQVRSDINNLGRGKDLTLQDLLYKRNEHRNDKK